MVTKKQLNQALGKEPADLVLKNAQIINCFSHMIERADIAISGEIILGIGSYKGKQEIDLKNAYVSAGFIDSHVHIESSMLTPIGFAKSVIPNGTLTVIADPHEIANVCGLSGIEYMIEAAKKTPLDAFFMMPSCVPATSFETNHTSIHAKAMSSFIKEHPIHGLGEVMSYPDVLNHEESLFEKLSLFQSKVIDGHSPGLSGKELNAYLLPLIQTDHEASTPQELTEKVSRGMYVLLREGSQTRNVKDLLQGVTKEKIPRLLFCTDDKHPEDIRKEGHINYNINLAIKHGLHPIDAIQMATLNPAVCYQLKGVGGIAPGYFADLVVFDDLYHIEPKMVFKKGIMVAKNGSILYETEHPYQNENVLDTIHINHEKLSFDLKLESDFVYVIGLIKNNVTTLKKVEKVTVKNGLFQNNPNQDLLKLAVVERHHQTGNVGLALVKGYGLKNGAIAQTIAHDSHNLILLGDNDQDMMRALHEIEKIGGGIVVVSQGKVEASLSLEVAGIMTNKDCDIVCKTLQKMDQIVRDMGVDKDIVDPFLQLAFLSLPVIPELKCTDYGLFDTLQYKNIKLEVKKG